MPKPYQPNDKWSKKAAAEGYRARSVYKLMELDERYRLLKSGMTVLDLGAAPGSWLQYVSERIGPKGKALGIDLTAIEEIAPNVHTYQQDMMDIPAIQALLEKEGITKVDLLLSDAAPNTSGIADVDQWRSVELVQSVMKMADAVLTPKGFMVAKVFRGADFDPLLHELRAQFNIVKVAHPAASRDRSKEVFIVAKR